MEQDNRQAEQRIVGVLSPSAETRAFLVRQLQAATFYCTPMELDQYCIEKSDRMVRRLIEAQPPIILIDMQEPQLALRSLVVLHDVLPETWFFVSAASDNPQLIIETMRAGAREFLPKPVALPSLIQALERFAFERQRTGVGKTRGKIYGVTAAKGGTGTTSVAINLAVSLATSRKVKVALLDLGSPMGDAAEYLNLKSTFSVSDAIASAQRLDPVLLESYMSRAHGIAVLPGIKDIQPVSLRPDEFAKLLQVASETYSHTFIDLFCSNDREQLEVLTEFSTALLVVLTPELAALWRTRKLIQLLEATGGGDKFRLVLNRSGKRQKIHSKEIEKTLGYSIYWSLPNNYPASIQAVNSGKPLISVNHSALASSYFALAQSLTGISLQTKRRKFLGLFC